MKPVLSGRWWFVFIIVGVLTVAAVSGLIWTVVGQRGPTLGACPPACPYVFTMPSTFAPSSTETAQIRDLFTLILVLAGIVFFVVEGLLLYSILKFRNRPPETALQIHGNTKLELAWTSAPAVILAVILGFTLRTMNDVKGPAIGEVLKVKVIGHQFWWEIQYPALNIVTASELVVPVNATVEIALESVDVEHGFWAPEQFGKVDAIPGYTTRIRFTPTAIGRGEYGGQCTQYCGTQHAQMRFSVIVKSAADFQAWAANQQQGPVEPAASSTVEAGQIAMLEGKNACIGCHFISGTTAQGKIGPDLTHLMSRSYIAGGILANTPDNLARWLHDPQGVKPGNKMAVNLDEATIQNIVAYLTTLQ